MENLATNLKYATRILLRNPGYACVAILTLAQPGFNAALLAAFAGLALVLAMASLLSGLLHGVSALDPATYAVVTAMVIVVALAACCLPARRATLVDPMAALRSE